MNKKSLYVTLISLCSVACALTVVAINTSKNSQLRDEAIRTNDEIIKHEVLEKPFQKPEVTEKSIEKEAVGKGYEEAKKEEEVPVVENVTPLVIPPVKNGEMLDNFTDSELVFHETYQDYRTHNGVDILTKKDTPVVAVKNGVVIKNEFDYEDGYTVEIEHDDGLVSVYKNLANDKTVKVGQVVKSGETIGTVGDSAVSESCMESHLHFEIKEDTIEVNPTDYITFSN